MGTAKMNKRITKDYLRGCIDCVNMTEEAVEFFLKKFQVPLKRYHETAHERGALTLAYEPWKNNSSYFFLKGDRGQRITMGREDRGSAYHETAHWFQLMMNNWEIDESDEKLIKGDARPLYQAILNEGFASYGGLCGNRNSDQFIDGMRTAIEWFKEFEKQKPTKLLKIFKNYQKKRKLKKAFFSDFKVKIFKPYLKSREFEHSLYSDPEISSRVESIGDSLFTKVPTGIFEDLEELDGYQALRAEYKKMKPEHRKRLHHILGYDIGVSLFEAEVRLDIDTDFMKAFFLDNFSPSNQIYFQLLFALKKKGHQVGLTEDEILYLREKLGLSNEQQLNTDSNPETN
jgi:hypothetical protein